MSYSIVGALALIINLIINRESFCSVKSKDIKSKADALFIIRYRQFLFVSCFYFLIDFAWGFLCEHHHIDKLFPVLYSDCVLYFIFMYLTMLTWMRSVVAYLNKKRRRSKILLAAVWFIFFLGLICLMINRFYPFIFSFNDKHEYVMESGRHIAFILQVVLYLVIAVYTFIIACHRWPSTR